MSLLGSTETRPRIPPLGEVAGLFNEAVSNRAALAAIELTEARLHAQTSVLLIGASVLLALLGGFALTLTVAGLVWDSPHRAWWLAGMCVAYLGGAALAAFTLHRRLQTWRPFADIRNQLQQDHRCLIQLVQSMMP